MEEEETEEVLDNLNNKSNNWGGKREGAGRPEGSLSPETLEKQKVLNEVKQRIMKKAQRLLDSQFSIAQGQQFLYKIEKTKVVGPKGGVSYRSEKPKLVTSEWEIQAYLDDLVDKENGEGEPIEAGDDYYFITTKEPVNQAIDSMLDRTFDKAGQNIKVDGQLDIKVGKLEEIQEGLKVILNGQNEPDKEDSK